MRTAGGEQKGKVLQQKLPFNGGKKGFTDTGQKRITSKRQRTILDYEGVSSDNKGEQ